MSKGVVKQPKYNNFKMPCDTGGDIVLWIPDTASAEECNMASRMIVRMLKLSAKKRSGVPPLPDKGILG